MRSSSPLRGFVSRSWSTLTAPSRELKEPAQRRQAQLLSALTFVMMVIGLVALLKRVTADPQPHVHVYLALVGWLAGITLSYAVGRTRFYRLAGLWLLASTTAGVLLVMPRLPPPDPVYGLGYLLPVVIMGSVLFSLRGTALFAAVLLLLAVLVAFVGPLPEPLRRPVLSGTLLCVLAGSLLVLAVTHSRNLLEEERREALERLTVELEQRVAERTRELAEANRELESFTSSVSHDLRAPLRALRGFSNLLSSRYGAQLPPEAQEYVGFIRDAARRMDLLIEDLLAFSRLTHRALARKPLSTEELTDLVRQVADELRAAEPAKGRKVELLIGSLPPCEADPILLRQVFANLLANAWKFTCQRDVARIEVAAEPASGRERPAYFVKDNGVGFDMQYAHKLFAPFQRLHSAEDFEGTGVGLALVRRIIERHQGRVWAHSQEGQGTTFFFTL